jgi:hypothetical protein
VRPVNLPAAYFPPPAPQYGAGSYDAADMSAVDPASVHEIQTFGVPSSVWSATAALERWPVDHVDDPWVNPGQQSSWEEASRSYYGGHYGDRNWE